MRAVLCALILCAAAGTGFAQLAMNELYVSHTGTDDQEFIELVGPGGMSLSGFAVLVVEGETPSNGTLDRVYDLAGQTMPADGYFVIGGAAVANLDLNVGTTNVLENATETFYLVQSANVGAIAALLATDISTGPNTTMIPSLSTIVDSVAMFDGTATDVVYDGATVVGPDGSFFPAGIFRGSDFPSPWCTFAFLDFDDVANSSEPRTPGAANGVCPGPNLPGTGSDCDMQVRINGAVDTQATDVHIVSSPTDVVAIEYVSPLGTLDGRGFLATLQLLPTATPPAGIPVPLVGTLYFDLTPGVLTVLLFNSLPGAPVNIVVPVIGTTEINTVFPANVFGSGLSVFALMIADDPANVLNFGFADTQEFRLQ